MIAPPNCLCVLNSRVHRIVLMALDLSVLKVLLPFVNSNLELSK